MKRRAAPDVEIENTFPRRSHQDDHYAMNRKNCSVGGGLAAGNHRNDKKGKNKNRDPNQTTTTNDTRTNEPWFDALREA